MEKSVVIGLTVVVPTAVVAGSYWWYQSRQGNGLTLYGNVGIRTVNLSFHVGRRVESPMVDESDAIKAGQMLGELDHKPYKATLMQARVGVSVAQTQYDPMLTGYRDEKTAWAAAAVRQAQAAYDYVQNFYNRQQGLWKNRTISVNDLENARSSRDQAQVTLESTQDKLCQYRSDSRKRGIAQVEVGLEQVQTRLAQAELNLQDLTLVASFDGTLLTRAVEPGTVFSEGGTVFTVSLTHPVWVRAYVDERNLSQAQPGREVLPYTDGHPSKPYHGQTGFAPPTAKFTPRTVETPGLYTNLAYRLRIVVTDADGALRQGMPVTVQFGDRAGHE